MARGRRPNVNLTMDQMIRKTGIIAVIDAAFNNGNQNDGVAGDLLAQFVSWLQKEDPTTFNTLVERFAIDKAQEASDV